MTSDRRLDVFLYLLALINLIRDGNRERLASSALPIRQTSLPARCHQPWDRWHGRVCVAQRAPWWWWGHMRQRSPADVHAMPGQQRITLLGSQLAQTHSSTGPLRGPVSEQAQLNCPLNGL
jgi:hypothetical protein